MNLLIELFKQLFLYVIVGGVCIKVYKELKADNITFAQYLMKRKERVIIAVIFIGMSVAHTIYMLKKI